MFKRRIQKEFIYMNTKIIDNLFSLIFSAEVAEPSIRSFYEKLQPDIIPFAE